MMRIVRKYKILVLGWALLTITTVFAAPSDKPTILICPKTLASSFWLTARAGAYQAANKFGVKIIWKGPALETDIAGQIAIIEDYSNKKVDAIALAACDVKALYAPVQKAMNKGIPVVLFDSGIEPDPTLSLIATDNLKASVGAGNVLANLIGGKGEVACIPYIPGASTSIMRAKGFQLAIRKFPNIKLVAIQYSESDVAKAMSVTENILTANPGLNGIFAANEPSAIGASLAVKTRKLSGKVKIVAFDASPGEIQMLKNDTIQALIVQNPYNMGYLAIKTCVDILQGKKVDKRIDTGVTVVTLDNLSDPNIERLLYPLGKKVEH